MLDFIVERGSVVFPGAETERVDLLVKDGKIVGIVEDASRLDAVSRFDASGMHVLPGAIDPHVHIGIEQPAEEDYYTETCAAAAGGVTTLFDMYAEKRSYRETLPGRVKMVERNAVVDVALHFDITVRAHLEDLQYYIQTLGQRSFKFRCHHRGVEKLKWDSDYPINDRFLFEVLTTAGQHGDDVRVLVHCQNGEIAPSPYLLNTLDLSGYRSTGLRLLKEIFAEPAEAIDVVKVLSLAEMTGSSAYIVHLTTKEAVQKLRETEGWSRRAFVEVCLGHLTLTNDDEIGLIGKTNPPIGDSADREALWAAVLEGHISTIGTDHCAMKLARKLGGGDVVSAALGYPAIATYLPTVITEGYRQRGIPLSRIVDLTSTNAARIFGLYPAKGTLRVGSDADLVAVDLEAARPVKAALLPGWSDFALNEGKTLTGWPALTMVRGTPVWQDGRIQTSRGYGKYVSRNRESTVTR